MTIDSDYVIGLDEWLASDQAKNIQGCLEDRIITTLFSHDPSSLEFQRIIIQLAWLGASPEAKPLLEREILALNLSNRFSVETCGFFRSIGKICKATGKFIANHAVEIAAGAAICATGVGIAYVTGYALSATIGGVIVAGAGSVFIPEKDPNPYIPRTPLPDPKACSKEEAFLMQQSCISNALKVELPSSVDQVLVTASGVWTGGNFYPSPTSNNSSLVSLLPSNRFSEYQVNWKDYTSYNLSMQLNQNTAYQLRGENALALGQYSQAIRDLNQSIQETPTDSISYLQRGAAYFHLQEYDRSLQDYQQFISQEPREAVSLSVLEFSIGFAKGLPNGVYESGEGLFLFMVDFVKHPIQTSGQVIHSVSTLVDLVRKDEWGVIAESLSPELHQLVTQWDALPSEKKGELAGYAVGKHGADILLPGALAKVASKSVKSAQELAALCKNLQIAQETLVLETAAGIGSSAKIAEVVRNSQTATFLGEELGFTAKEMGQLKKLGKLEQTLDSACESWLAKSPSEAYIAAKNGGRHADLIPKFSEKSIKEIEKSIRSYEKLIAEHNDKIVNPSKYCQDWDNFHPNRKKALVEKVWPAEIQCYTEQKDILKTILDQRQ